MQEYKIILNGKVIDYIVAQSRKSESDIKKSLINDGYPSNVIVKMVKSYGE